MGLHGKPSNGPRKAPRRHARPHSSVRVTTEMSPAYLDLLNAGYWADPRDPEREAAWEEWRERILDER
ncbi:hypothetical protein [Mesorhizobium sangaii]|uniref:Uncharacterized protein n=1 Tax=Mesorhizobium sangaii TaxID=505389 RepID=A0A841PKR0_9HYPH|nr:hypothetical protein [Mesorhizobium sangaii]MBB6411280.1 hypothetical protein [Mesorhizobium sangaii]